VLSPYFFSIYIDSVVEKVIKSNVGCYIKWICMSILLILLIAPSVTSLQQLQNICEQELEWLDMSLNAKKSTCIRMGPRFNASELLHALIRRFVVKYRDVY